MSPDAPSPFGRVAVLGLGLMGGSYARAVRALGAGPEVVGWSPDRDEVDAALAAGAIDARAPDPVTAAAGADLVVLATPLGAACALMERLAGALKDGAIVTDVVSLKSPMRDAAARAGLGTRWVGSHPMCGGERSGFDASRADLYVGARVWITMDGAPESAVQAIVRLWTSLGARPEATDAERHDALMGRVSHLPQLAANALAAVLAEAGVGADDLGPGGADMTRLAGSSPTVWRDLLAHAPPSLPGSLRDLSERLKALADLVDAGDLDALEGEMTATRTWRAGP